MCLDDLWTPLNDETIKQLKNWDYCLVKWRNGNYAGREYNTSCPLIACVHYWSEDIWAFGCQPFGKAETWWSTYGEENFPIEAFILLPKYDS